MAAAAAAARSWVCPEAPYPAVAEEVEAELRAYAAMQPTPVTLKDILSAKNTRSLAKFLHGEVPIRIAERLNRIETDLPGWQQNESIRQVHESLRRSFVALRRVRSDENLEEFTQVVSDVIWEEKPAVVTMARGLCQLRAELGEKRFSCAFTDAFLDGFLLNRIGSNVLMSQYLAFQGHVIPAGDGANERTGIIDVNCDPSQICRQVADEVADICEEKTGLRPIIRVEAYSAVGVDLNEPKFPYIPTFLRYMICELLKNSCKATTEVAKASNHSPRAELSRRPIFVVVCADETKVAIRIGDRARGIPFSVGSHIWSYLYSTADRGPSELAGYGVGLPLSRLYARYLGGSLDLISMPGFGTDAYLMLPRLEGSQVEVLPDLYQKYTYTSLTDLCL